jgi:predicted nucleic acid-binding protein
MTLFLDANVIIYLIEGAREFQTRAADRIASFLKGAPSSRMAVSRLSWLECRVRPLREKNQKALDAYESFFAEPDLIIIDLTAPVIETATQIRATVGFSTPDALQAACALQIPGTVQVISNDVRFQKISGLTVEAV